MLQKYYYLTFYFQHISRRFAAHLTSQQRYIGHNAWLTFNTTDGSPQAVFDGQIAQIEGCASILIK